LPAAVIKALHAIVEVVERYTNLGADMADVPAFGSSGDPSTDCARYRRGG
jgi:hypothetical protein